MYVNMQLYTIIVGRGGKIDGNFLVLVKYNLKDLMEPLVDSKACIYSSLVPRPRNFKCPKKNSICIQYF